MPAASHCGLLAYPNFDRILYPILELSVFTHEEVLLYSKGN